MVKDFESRIVSASAQSCHVEHVTNWQPTTVDAAMSFKSALTPKPVGPDGTTGSGLAGVAMASGGHSKKPIHRYSSNSCGDNPGASDLIGSKSPTRHGAIFRRYPVDQSARFSKKLRKS